MHSSQSTAWQKSLLQGPYRPESGLQIREYFGIDLYDAQAGVLVRVQTCGLEINNSAPLHEIYMIAPHE